MAAIRVKGGWCPEGLSLGLASTIPGDRVAIYKEYFEVGSIGEVN